MPIHETYTYSLFDTAVALLFWVCDSRSVIDVHHLDAREGLLMLMLALASLIIILVHKYAWCACVGSSIVNLIH